jgi:hypothetical protein
VADHVERDGKARSGNRLALALLAAGLLCPGAAPARPGPIDLRVEHVAPSAVIQLLRDQQCAAVSFIEVAHTGTISLDLRGVAVGDVLQEIARRAPAYRGETIDGRDVLYPAAPAFQTVLDGVEIREMPRVEASIRYLERLRKEVPAFAELAAPLVIGNAEHPIYTTKVSLRPRGRVIENLVDLLGPDPRVYFEFDKAMSGVPELSFERVKCAAPH